MKTLNFHKTLHFLLASFLLISCEKNQAPSCQFIEPVDGYTVTRGDIISISAEAADAEGVISEMRLYISEEGLATLEFPYKYDLNTADYSSGSYTLKATVRDAEGLEASDEIQVIIDAAYSVVTTSEATSITYNTALAGGSVSDDGGGEIIEYGVYWDTISSPETAGKQVSMGQGLGDFTGTLSELPHGQQVYYKAYAQNSAGISVGEEFSFITNTVPTVQTSTIQSIAYDSALVGGEISSDGGETITEKGVYWSTDPIAELTGTRLPIESEAALFNTTLKNLSIFTTYYIKAFATNAAGESIGEEISFTTTGTATVITLQARSDKNNSLVLNGEVSDNGGNEVTETGFYFGTSQDPSSSGTKIPVGSGLGAFTSTLEDLNQGTTYFVVAYAVNSSGESLGEEITFTTPEILSLQPGGADGKDAVFSKSFPDGNWGDLEDIHLYAWTQGGDLNINRVVMDFDLSSLPVDAQIDSAFISFYYNSTSAYGSGHSGENSFVIQRITSDWDESTVSWNSQPTSTEMNQVFVTGAASSSQDFPDINITELIRDMASDKPGSYGLFLRLQQEAPYIMLQIASSDHPDESIRPKLVVYYSPE